MIIRQRTKRVKVGKIAIGGGAPIVVQTMTTTKTSDAAATIKPINNLVAGGAELVRVAVPDMPAARALKVIKRSVTVPLVADIHFDYQLALMAIKNGADKIRINPGNIGDRKKIAEIIASAKRKKISIRIGVNAGSLEKKLLGRYPAKVTAEALAMSAVKWVKFFEQQKFYNLVVSVKASDAERMIAANKILAKKIKYPLHLGVTEAGGVRKGSIWSAVGIGALLAEGIGDTIRVSLTGDPQEEVYAAWEILKSLGLRERGISVTSCPTCGRCQVNLIQIANRIEAKLEKMDSARPLRVAIMGCVVNGPGEAREADLGVACGLKCGVIFKKGKIIKTVKEQDIEKEIITAVRDYWKND